MNAGIWNPKNILIKYSRRIESFYSNRKTFESKDTESREDSAMQSNSHEANL